MCGPHPMSPKTPTSISGGDQHMSPKVQVVRAVGEPSRLRRGLPMSPKTPTSISGGDQHLSPKVQVVRAVGEPSRLGRGLPMNPKTPTTSVGRSVGEPSRLKRGLPMNPKTPTTSVGRSVGDLHMADHNLPLIRSTAATGKPTIKQTNYTLCLEDGRRQRRCFSKLQPKANRYLLLNLLIMWLRAKQAKSSKTPPSQVPSLFQILAG